MVALARRGGKGAHADRYRETKEREEMETAMTDVHERQTIAKEDVIRSILDAYAQGEDGAACMTALAPLVEWLLEDHAYLLEALYEPHRDDYEVF